MLLDYVRNVLVGTYSFLGYNVTFQIVLSFSFSVKCDSILNHSLKLSLKFVFHTTNLFIKLEQVPHNCCLTTTLMNYKYSLVESSTFRKSLRCYTIIDSNKPFIKFVVVVNKCSKKSNQPFNLNRQNCYLIDSSILFL